MSVSKDNTELKDMLDIVKKEYDKPQSDEFYERFIDKFEPNKKKKIFYRVIKRTLDIVFSFLAMVLLLPFFIAIAIAIRIDSKGPVIFKQDRVGKGNEVFCFFKFRSMRSDAPHDVATSLLDDSDEYLTKVGRFLRRTSLDELPQLLNIFLGSMSFIGYRPLIVTEENCNEMRNKLGVFALRPGISGYAQVNGRDDVYYKNKAIMDADYVKNASLWLDLRLFFRPIAVVFSKNGNADEKKGKEKDASI